MPSGSVDGQPMSAEDIDRDQWRLRWWWLAAALLLLTFGFALAVQTGGPRVVLVIDDLTQLGTAGAAVLATGWAAWRHSDRERLAWASVCVGVSAWAAGQRVWCF